MSKIKMSIGEFSKLCFVTVKTLRHYEKLGLLTPHNVDEWTHYRYYDVSQMQRMQQICKLKALGLSLNEIKIMLEDEILVPEPAIIEEKIASTEKQICVLRNRLLALQNLQNPNKKTHKMSKIVLKPLPGGVVASWRCHLKSYEELGEKLISIVLPEMQRIGVVCPKETEYCYTVDYNRNHKPGDIDLEYCEIVEKLLPDTEILKFRKLPVVETAVCIGHYGDYNSFGSSVAEVFRYIEEKGYTITDHPRFCYIHGVWDCDNVADWLTEIQIPVKTE